jgi:hypothetical protein
MLVILGAIIGAVVSLVGNAKEVVKPKTPAAAPVPTPVVIATGADIIKQQLNTLFKSDPSLLLDTWKAVGPFDFDAALSSKKYPSFDSSNYISKIEQNGKSYIWEGQSTITEANGIGRIEMPNSQAIYEG